MTEWRGACFPADRVVSEEAHAKITEILEFLTSELQILISDVSYISECEKHVSLSRGDFWNVVNKNTHKPHLKWKIEGSKARYYRMIQERIHHTLDSLHERQRIAEICKKFGWDEEELDEIRDELAFEKLFPTSGNLRNILKSQKIPQLKKDLQAHLDFTVGDTQLVKDLGDCFSVKIFDEWFRVEKFVPEYIRDGFTGKVSNPIFQMKDGELMVRFSYKIEPKKTKRTKLVGGLDLGKVKSFALSIIGEDGSYSEEKEPSRELERLNSKIRKLEKEKKLVSEKKRRVEKYLKNSETARTKWERLDQQAKLIANKLSGMKDHAGWLVARDVVTHLEQNETSKLHVENLRWLDSKGGKWDHGAVRAKVEEVGKLHGITVTEVNAKDSSHTDPFDDSRVDPKGDRSVELSNGEIWDRDRTASTEIARRKPKSKEKIDLIPSKSRDKTGPTPKRPKKKTRRKIRLESKKNVGTFQVVAFPGGTRETTPRADETAPTYKKLFRADCFKSSRT